MAKQRSDVDQQIADLLRTAKTSLKMTATFLTRMDGTTQHLEVVESSIPLLFPEGSKAKQDTSLCQAVRDGELPPVMPDLKAFPAAMALPAARLPRIRSFVTVPVRLSDGTLYGTFCAAGLTSDPELTERDRALMEVLASAAATLLELQVDLGQGWFYGRPGPASALDGGATSDPEPEPTPVVVPQPRTAPEQASRRPRWTPWSASRGRRRADSASGSYPGV